MRVAHGEWGHGHYREQEKEIRRKNGMEGDGLRERWPGLSVVSGMILLSLF